MRSAATLAMVATILAGCATPLPVPVRDQSTVREGWTHYRVGSGDTLYSIAWLLGMDYRELAGYNGIEPPYTIYAGQQLRLTRPAGQAAPVAGSKPPAPRQPQAKPANPGPPSRDAAPVPEKSRTGPVERWMWPTRGPVITGFSVSRGSKGIDIAGSAGQAVMASAAGDVVYAGNGLRGYGNLIIIKHNETFLSAYAHNRTIAVREGQSVRQGQKIAEMGNSGTNRVMLHFELRRNGEPVNPVDYLPRQPG